MSAESTKAPSLSRRYEIDASMSASRAVAIILEKLRGVIEKNEPGVMERRGEEFLHDYRVAIRRTRSVLALFGHTLPEGMRRRGKKFFRSLARRTGNARDLDVLQLALPGYAVDAAIEGPESLAWLEQRVERESDKHYEKIRGWLGEAGHRQAMSSWRGEIEQLAVGAGGESMVVVAAEAVQAAATRVERRMAQIIEGDAEASLHRLRIQCKKLRYALEFSAALTPGGEVDLAILFLKAWQDRLGDHQDLVVHEKWLAELCRLQVEGSEEALLGSRLVETVAARGGSLGRSIEADTSRFRAELRSELEPAIAALTRADQTPRD